jgi:hypothetical protein
VSERIAGRVFSPSTAPKYFDAGLKVGWAQHHLDLLGEQVTAYLGDDPYTISTKDDLEAGEHIIELNTKPMRVEIGLIAGDFLSCLRGSLDHLATGLTRVRGGTASNTASFPVIGVDNGSGRKRFNEAVSGVTPNAIEVIKSLQPYHSGDAYKLTKLWRLHRLWNIDKHRRIPFHPTLTQMTVMSPSDVTPLFSGSNNNGVLRLPIAAKGKLNFNPSVKIIIQFGDESEGIVVPYEELIDIHHFVRDDVMPRFKYFFQ